MEAIGYAVGVGIRILSFAVSLIFLCEITIAGYVERDLVVTSCYIPELVVTVVVSGGCLKDVSAAVQKLNGYTSLTRLVAVLEAVVVEVLKNKIPDMTGGK